MTPADFLTCDIPGQMMDVVATAGERKLRLAACAFCRFNPVIAARPELNQIIELAERWADGQATGDEIVSRVNPLFDDPSTQGAWFHHFGLGRGDGLFASVQGQSPDRTT
jgi:hypothetical protein